MTGIVCEHGSLCRQCELCQRDEDIKGLESRAKKLEEALQHISNAFCLYELLGEPPTDAEGEPAACECPGCVARRVLRVDAVEREGK